jgi:hypothetical protein
MTTVLRRWEVDIQSFKCGVFWYLLVDAIGWQILEVFRWISRISGWQSCELQLYVPTMRQLIADGTSICSSAAAAAVEGAAMKSRKLLPRWFMSTGYWLSAPTAGGTVGSHRGNAAVSWIMDIQSFDKPSTIFIFLSRLEKSKCS